MRVILEPSLFERNYTTELFTVMWLGLIGRHRVMVAEIKAKEYRSYLSQLGSEQREEWETVLELCVSAEAKEPAAHEVRVATVRDSAWATPPPRLTMDDALTLLVAPYRILVENGINDRAFLLALCSKAQREYLEKRIELEWLEVEHCGGTGHMKKRVKQLRKSVSKYLRCSVLFDSDALYPGAPGNDSQAIANACGSDVHPHQLKRRYIESYLPQATLKRWAKDKRIDREPIVLAFDELSAEQRHHFNMKEGLGGDINHHGLKKDKTAQTFFDAILRLDKKKRPRLQGKLQSGFGDDIAKLFGGKLRPGDFKTRDEFAGRKEIERFVDEVIERIR